MKFLQKLPALIPSVLLLLVASMPAFAASAGRAETWQLLSDKDGIKVYTRAAEGSRLKAFRGVTTLTITDWSAIGGVINDYANAPRWLYFVSAVQEIGRRGALDRDIIFQTDLPWPVSDREAVVTVKGWNPPGSYDTVIRFSNAPALLPVNGDFVRFPELNARFDFRWLGGNRAEVTYEVIADPGGYLPGWLVNMVLRDAPFITLQRFAKAVARPEYQGRHYDYIVVPPVYSRGK